MSFCSHFFLTLTLHNPPLQADVWVFTFAKVPSPSGCVPPMQILLWEPPNSKERGEPRTSPWDAALRWGLAVPAMQNPSVRPQTAQDRCKKSRGRRGGLFGLFLNTRVGVFLFACTFLSFFGSVCFISSSSVLPTLQLNQP